MACSGQAPYPPETQIKHLIPEKVPRGRAHTQPTHRGQVLLRVWDPDAAPYQVRGQLGGAGVGRAKGKRKSEGKCSVHHFVASRWLVSSGEIS